MRRTAVVATALGVGAAWVVPSSAATQGVRVGSFYFEDASAGDGRVVVDAGDRITFTFEGQSQHTATVDGVFDSGRRSAPQTYTTSALTRAGTYTLYCAVHGAANHGTSLVVRGTAASPSPSPSPAPVVSPRPSPSVQPTRTAAAAPTPTRTSPRASAAPSPTPSPAAAATRSASPVVALPAASPVQVSAQPTAPATSAATSPTPVAAQPSAEDDSGRSWVLPGLFALLVLLAVAGTALAARSRRTD